MAVEIRRLTESDFDLVIAASHLFDGPAQVLATRRFLRSPTHHFFLAQDDGKSVGFITGVETTHPDKGVEMFLYELAVDEPYRRRGIGRQLTETLATYAREHGCYDMWVGTEPDNEAALATYLAAGANKPEEFVVLVWDFPENSSD